MDQKHTLALLFTTLAGISAITSVSDTTPLNEQRRPAHTRDTEEKKNLAYRSASTEYTKQDLDDHVLTIIAESVPAIITHYCNCIKCCGKSRNNPAYGITANGQTAKKGTIAAPKKVKFGSEVIINGIKYIVNDRGRSITIKENGTYHFDIWCNSHEEAKQKGIFETTAIIKYDTKR